MSQHGSPIGFALAFAADQCAAHDRHDGLSVAVLIAFGVSFAYAAVFFYLVQRVAESILLLLVVVFAGAALYVMIPVWVIAGARSQAL